MFVASVITTRCISAEPDSPLSVIDRFALQHGHSTTCAGSAFPYDDTPGLERITERHKSGTKYEIDANGSKNETIVRDNYQLVAGHDTLEVYGNVKIVVGGDADIAVAGSLTASVTGNIAADSQGDITLKATETGKKIILDGDVDTAQGCIQLCSNAREYFSRGVQFGLGQNDG